jgi:hypothetical protein
MAQNRKSMKRSGKFGRPRPRRRTHRGRPQPQNNLFDWSSVVPRASIKSKTRFHLKNDWGLRVKGILKI